MTSQALSSDAPTIELDSARPLYRGAQTVWLVVTCIDLTLLLRFLLKGLGAPDTDGFIRLVYTVSKPFTFPFMPAFSLNMDYATIEWGTILAIVMYTLIGAALVRFMTIMKPTIVESDQEVVEYKKVVE